MKYRISFNMHVDPFVNKRINSTLESLLERDNLGYICYQSASQEMNEEGDHDKWSGSERRVNLSKREGNLENLLEILDEFGLVSGSSLSHDEESYEIGKLSLIEVIFMEKGLHRIARDKLILLEEKIFEALGSLCKWTARYFGERKRRYYFYVTDVELALPIVEKLVRETKLIEQYEIQTVRSGYGLADEYFIRVKRNYKERNKKKYTELKALCKGADEKVLSTLVEKYPKTPEAFVQLLNLADGSKDFPFLLCEEVNTQFFLLSAKEMMESKERWKELRKDRMEALFDPRIKETVSETDFMLIGKGKSAKGEVELYLDFNPNTFGRVGQVVTYLEKSKEFLVVAPSFECLLLEAMDADFWNGLIPRAESKKRRNDKGIKKKTKHIFWKFHQKFYNSDEAFTLDFKSFMEKEGRKISDEELTEIIIDVPEILLEYEARVADLSELKENELIEFPEDESDELYEDWKEDGFWFLMITAHLRADSERGFTLAELMRKVQNQAANKIGAEHFSLNGFEYLKKEYDLGEFLVRDEGILRFRAICKEPSEEEA